MERYTMFLDLKTQHCENDSTTQSNLQIQCIPIKLPVAFFTELEQKISQFVWKHKRPQKAKTTLRKKNWKYHASWLQTILQNYSNQNSMVLAQKQTYRSMEQNREPRNKPTHLLSINIWQRRQEYSMDEERHFSKWYWENWTIRCKRMKLDHFLTSCTKINSKWITDLKVRLKL